MSQAKFLLPILLVSILLMAFPVAFASESEVMIEIEGYNADATGIATTDYALSMVNVGASGNFYGYLYLWEMVDEPLDSITLDYGFWTTCEGEAYDNGHVTTVQTYNYNDQIAGINAITASASDEVYLWSESAGGAVNDISLYGGYNYAYAYGEGDYSVAYESYLNVNTDTASGTIGAMGSISGTGAFDLYYDYGYWVESPLFC